MSQWFADPPVYAALNRATGDTLSALEAALAEGGDPNAADYRGYVPLGCSAVRNDPQLMAALLRAGADPNAMNRGNYLIASTVSLLRATRERQQVATLLDFIRALLSAGADPLLGKRGFARTDACQPERNTTVAM
ncbi:MAG TPA: hypothetical protein DCQ06_04025 [Myxococcales bacterium]|nr:hypothetical protein [Myxococcales bacterium]HAN30742.1 hypothetical protein [Myxococcales bacterium]